MRWLLFSFAVLCGVTAQAKLRPLALANRDAWPAVHTARSPALRHAAPVLGNEVTADLLWVQTLVTYGGTMFDDTEKFPELERYLNAIFDIDPRFKSAYRWAAFAVTFRDGGASQEEYWASIHFLERAMKQYPDDHQYFWLAGLRYFYDLWPEDKDLQRTYRERGAAYIEEAMRKPGAPPRHAALAAALRTKLGQREHALQDLKEKILTVSDPESRTQLIARLRTIYSAPDLADDLERETKKLRDSWQRAMPYAPPTLFFIIGEPTSRTFDLAQLAEPSVLAHDDVDESPSIPTARELGPTAPDDAPDAADAAGDSAKTDD